MNTRSTNDGGITEMAKYRKLGRTSSQRKALLRNQVTNLLYHGKIRTTETKAGEIRKIAEAAGSPIAGFRRSAAGARLL